METILRIILLLGQALRVRCLRMRLQKAGKTCLVIDRRNHIAGNIYTEK